MAQFTHLDISKIADDTVMDGGQIYRGERGQKTALHRRAMDVGIVHRSRILNQELFQVFRIVRKAVHQGFNEKAVLDMNHFIIMERDLQAFMVEGLPLGLQFISPDITLIEDRIIHDAFSQKITSGQAGTFKSEIKRMVGSQPIKGIKLSELGWRDEVANSRGHVKGRFSEVDVNPINDPVDQFFELFHASSYSQRSLNFSAKSDSWTNL